jgi:hypothetical protein
VAELTGVLLDEADNGLPGKVLRPNGTRGFPNRGAIRVRNTGNTRGNGTRRRKPPRQPAHTTSTTTSTRSTPAAPPTPTASPARRQASSSTRPGSSPSP